MNPVAFVTPWFGPDLVGGAEQQLFQVSTRLARRGHRVEVLTTCCRSFRDNWARNHFPRGDTEISDVLVRRFPVGPRDADAFDAANREFLLFNDRLKRPGVCPVSAGAASAFVRENINSPGLLQFLERQSHKYEAIVFGPYLYGPSLLGVALAGGRAFLQPMLHDETYAYLPSVEELFHKATRLLFNSEGEVALAARLYGPSVWRKGVVTGEGVEVPDADASAASRPCGPGLNFGSYLLYLGRRDRTKNTDLLLRAFERYRSTSAGSRMTLVLAGPGELPWGGVNPEGIIDLGLVPEAEKAWLLKHCRALVQPSRNESFSRTIMEAWFYGRPVVVHEDCLATSLAVGSSGGGWVANSETEWADAFARLERSDEGALLDHGRRGRAYALERADWDKAISRYESELGLLPRARAPTPHPRSALRVHQLTPDLAHGDAISNQAIFTRQLLLGLGHQAEIFVQNAHAGMEAHCKVFEPGVLRRDDVLLYHHSIGSPLTQAALKHAGPKALVYHNITPAHFFANWMPDFAKLLEHGREDLRALAPAFPVNVGDSAYNADELRDAGFSNPGVLPIFVDPLRWDVRPDPEWMATLQDGRTNLLFVGRVAPNKCQHHLLLAFQEYLAFDPLARLVLVGGWEDGHPYPAFVREQAEALGVTDNVLMLRRATEAQLNACYRTAHLFWSMSEHEGFGVPLVESMWFDVPVFAYRSSAVPETLGPAGLMFTEKRWPELAALAHLLVHDAPLRRTVLAAQRIRRRSFLPESVQPSFLQLLRKLGVDTAGALDPSNAGAADQRKMVAASSR